MSNEIKSMESAIVIGNYVVVELFINLLADLKILQIQIIFKRICKLAVMYNMLILLILLM